MPALSLVPWTRAQQDPSPEPAARPGWATPQLLQIQHSPVWLLFPESELRNVKHLITSQRCKRKCVRGDTATCPPCGNQRVGSTPGSSGCMSYGDCGDTQASEPSSVNSKGSSPCPSMARPACQKCRRPGPCPLVCFQEAPALLTGT